jgi:putative restriction endonuclease
VIRAVNPDSAFAPTSGYRYDGLFRVTAFWHERGRSGFRVYRFRLEKVGVGDEAVTETGAGDGGLLAAGNPAPGRRTTVVQRIARSTPVADGVKALHTFQCQVCGEALVLPSGPYAEAAHIRPLGRPHNGPDTADNVLCLCPNHHVLFDAGAIWVGDDGVVQPLGIPLRRVPRHILASAHLSYPHDNVADS